MDYAEVFNLRYGRPPSELSDEEIAEGVCVLTPWSVRAVFRDGSSDEKNEAIAFCREALASGREVSADRILAPDDAPFESARQFVIHMDAD